MTSVLASPHGYAERSGQRTIKRRRLTQAAKATALMAIDHTKVSALPDGRLGDFSSDRLTRLSMRLGQDIEVAVKPRPRGRAWARLRLLVDARAQAGPRGGEPSSPGCNLSLVASKTASASPRTEPTYRVIVGQPQRNNDDPLRVVIVPGATRRTSRTIYRVGSCIPRRHPGAEQGTVAFLPSELDPTAKSPTALAVISFKPPFRDVTSLRTGGACFTGHDASR